MKIIMIIIIIITIYYCVIIHFIEHNWIQDHVSSAPIDFQTVV